VTEFVCRRTGRTHQVGEQLDQDGHAVVHAVAPASSGLAVKRYLPETLSRRPDLEARIRAMITNPPAYRTGRSDSVICAWPEDAASVSGQFTGFVMPRVDTRGALTIHDVATSPHTTWRDRVTVAENLARAVAVLHDGDVVIGDFRGRNVLTWSDGRVTLLGCDRMQVVDRESGRRFPCVAARDACTPPELLLASLTSTLRTSSSDIYPLAVQLHQLLLLGAHPFRGQWRGRGDRPAEHVLAQDGLWAYAGDQRLDPDPGVPPLTVLPETLQQYFRAAFVDGARNPGARPPAHEWLTELVRLRESLVTCALEPAHGYGRHLPSCPWCGPGAVAPSPAPGPPGYLPRRTSSPPPTAVVEESRSAPSAPRTAPSDPRKPVPTRHLEPAPPRRPRIGLHAGAWAAVVVVGIGGVIGVTTATRRPAAPAADPTVTASTGTTGAQSPVPLPEDPTEALQQIRTQDAAVVETLAESWVAQLATRPAGAQTADRAATDAAVLAGHTALRKQYPGSVLLWSPDWNYDGRFWITVRDERFGTAEDANAWCDTHRFAKQACFAKKLSHSGVVEGSARYRG
ncbi:MAG: hypothetical protein QOK35_1608, partial [Pseudonocardiales bacterium]|nr:hypothetical protein [Pseudonocardiales bacterium]